MNVDDYVFDLPEHLIAAHPAARRDESRLMVVRGGTIEHRHFDKVGEYLRAGDVLVLNDSRVIPARLYAHRTTGGRVEMLLLNPEGSDRRWRALVRPAKKLHRGERLIISQGELQAVIDAEHDGGERMLVFECDGDFRAQLERHGQLPLPPYIIKRRVAEAENTLYGDEDRERYQTVYAREDGSVAAPTAGLHFTPELLDRLRGQGIETRFVTLHVGAGTFQPMAEGGRVEDHKMHFEEYEITGDTAAAITRAKAEGRRVVAVGTTSVRTLESAWDDAAGVLRAGRASTDMMIAPGYRFRVVDALLTNFHLPRSTLLLLVSALAGRDTILKAYAEAIAREYRFFSYGDGMLIGGNGEW